MNDWLLLSLGSLTLGLSVILMRFGRQHGARPAPMMLFIGLVPCLATAPFVWNRLGEFSCGYAALMVAGGLLGYGGQAALIEALGRGPVGPTFIIRSFAILVPVAASALFYDEPLGPTRVAGLALACLAIPLLQTGHTSPGASAEHRRAGAVWLAYCLASLALLGGADWVFRDAARPNASFQFILGVVFLGYLGNILGAVVAIPLGRAWPTRADALWGSAAGLCSLAAFALSLLVLRHLGGVLVFPARSVISIAAALALAFLFFRERPALRAAAGMALGAAGIVLLAMK